jgi:hypothetical protein
MSRREQKSWLCISRRLKQEKPVLAKTSSNLTDRPTDRQKSYKILRIIMFAVYGKAKPDTQKFKTLKLGGGQAYDRSSG